MVQNPEISKTSCTNSFRLQIRSSPLLPFSCLAVASNTLSPALPVVFELLEVDHDFCRSLIDKLRQLGLSVGRGLGVQPSFNPNDFDVAGITNGDFHTVVLQRYTR